MNDFERFLHAVDRLAMQKPPFYGLYHIVWLCVTIVACAFIFAYAKSISARAVDVTLIVWGVALIALELMKQVLCSFHFNGEGAAWFYEWHAFPFQFCSTPLFIALPAGLLKKGRLKSALQSFLALFAIVGGTVAMLYPANMFTGSVFINLHTMIWHSSMVAVCFMLLATKTVLPTKNSFFGGFSVFVVLTVVALTLNVAIGGHMGIRGFNLFFISPYEAVNVPIVKFAYRHLPYPLIPLLYVVIVSLAALLVLMTTHAVEKHLEKVREKRLGNLLT